MYNIAKRKERNGKMSLNEKKRGFVSEDSRWFSEDSLKILRTAQEEVQWLLDRGYNMKSVIQFVGNHYLLSLRQRAALQRATSPKVEYDIRRNKLYPLEAIKEGTIHIDGFNLIITLEVALSGSVLILGRDGVIRDLAGLRGTYRIIDKTYKALNLIGMALKNLNVPEVVFYLDSPVSNSGMLKKRILDYYSGWNFIVNVELVPNSDVSLSAMDRVVTGDSIILNNCKGWFNLGTKIIEDYIADAWIVDLS